MSIMSAVVCVYIYIFVLCSSVQYIGSWSTVNGLMKGWLIDSYSHLLILISTCPQGSMSLSRFHCSLPCVALPSPQFDCWETDGLGESQTLGGMTWIAGGGQDEHLWDEIIVASALEIVFINPIFLLLPHHFVFTAFVVWCRSTSRREMNWHLTKFSTRKLVSVNTILFIPLRKIIRIRRIR